MYLRRRRKKPVLYILAALILGGGVFIFKPGAPERATASLPALPPDPAAQNTVQPQPKPPAVLRVPLDAPLTHQALSKAQVEHFISTWQAALTNDDYGSFYGQLSNLWQKQTTADKLRLDFSSLKSVPEISELLTDKTAIKMAAWPLTTILPAEGDVLKASGAICRENAEKPRLDFTATYIYEKGAWKPAALDAALFGE